MTPAAGHCASCPLAPGVPCLGERSPAACVHVGRGRADWIALVTGRALPPGVAAARDMNRRINACPHRGCNAGCGTATCARGRGLGGVVGSMDCEACPDLPP